MFWKKRKESKPPRPKSIPDIVGGHLVTDFDQDPDWVWKLKAVLRRREESKNAFDVRVYDEVETATKKIRVEDWASLDEHPEIILYEGWFNTETQQLQLEGKRTV